MIDLSATGKGKKMFGYRTTIERDGTMSELIWARTSTGYTAKGFERRYHITREGARAWNLREESAGVLATTATLKDAQAIAEADAIAARAEERAKWEEFDARDAR